MSVVSINGFDAEALSNVALAAFSQFRNQYFRGGRDALDERIPHQN
jgi:hypothetical protein